MIEFRKHTGEKTTCDEHMMAGRAATHELWVRGKPVAHLCLDCVRQTVMVGRSVLAEDAKPEADKQS